MAIQLAYIAPDADTFVAPTGGTQGQLTGTYDSGTKLTAHYLGDDDFLSRATVEFTVKKPIAQSSAPGGYTQIREQIVIKRPMTLANGNRTINTATLSFARDPEMSSTDFMSLQLEVAQILGFTAFQEFWTANDLS